MAQVFGLGGAGLEHDCEHDIDHVQVHFTSSPVLDQLDNTADCTLDDTLTRSTKMTTTVGDAASAFLIDPQWLADDIEEHLPLVHEGTQTTLHLDLDDIILVVPRRGGCLQLLLTVPASRLLDFDFIARFSPTDFRCIAALQDVELCLVL